MLFVRSITFQKGNLFRWHSNSQRLKDLADQQAPGTYDKNTYILATDADMLFNDTSVLDLVNVCNEDLRLGAACGRTHPMGKKINPIVWYQIFEYAKG